MSKIYLLKEFASFIRIENGIFACGISLSGFIIFNGLSLYLLPLFITIFSGTCASYSYNYMKDSGEDLINKKRLNRFVSSPKTGYLIVISLFSLGLVNSFRFSQSSILVFLAMMALSIIYSGYARLKRRFLIKNITTGFVISLTFLYGTLSLSQLSPEMLAGTLIVFLLGFSANILGDIRGNRGDMAVGIKTIPILLGFEKTRNLLYILLIFLSFLVFSLGLLPLVPIVPFMIVSILLLSRGRLRDVRISFFSSFITLPFILTIFNFLEVI